MTRARPTPPAGRRPPGRAGQQAAPKPWWRSVWAAILGVGALAGVVTAVITLVATLTPDPDPVDRVTVTAAALTAQPLSGYAATAVLRPVPGGSGADVIVVRPELLAEDDTTSTTAPGTDSTTPSSTTPSSTTSGSPPETSGTTSEPPPETSMSEPPPETSTSEPTVTTSSGTSTTSSTSGTTTDSSTESSPTDFTPAPEVSATLGTEEQEDLYCAMVVRPEVVDIQLPTCEDVQDAGVVVEGDGEVRMPPPSPTPRTTLLDDDGTPVPPEVAAERLAASLEGVRTASTEGRRDPVGMRATVTLEIEGLRNRPLDLYWRLSAAPGGSPLPPEWAAAVPACRLVPGTDLDTASIDVWIPLPAPRGPFLIDFYVAVESTPLTSYRTEAFD